MFLHAVFFVSGKQGWVRNQTAPTPTSLAPNLDDTVAAGEPSGSHGAALNSLSSELYRAPAAWICAVLVTNDSPRQAVEWLARRHHFDSRT